MSKEVAIEAVDICKDFKVSTNKKSSIKEFFIHNKSSSKRKQNVLDNISFKINKGDFYGILGRNGSGKSTLLKILVGVYSPSNGRVIANGKITPFIELGVGFNMELSGKDNVYLSGSLLGFSRREMDLIYDEIVEFSELRDSMNKKLKNYSSGMQVRLAFSIAIMVKSDILIFDEVLAVGDVAFQKKCLDVFEKYKASGQTVVLVTHDMETVRRFCNKALIIENGKIAKIGNPINVTNEYIRINQEDIDNNSIKIVKEGNTSLKITNKDNQIKSRFDYGDTIRVWMSWNNINEELIESVGINVYKLTGEHITGFNTRSENGFNKSAWIKKGELYLDLRLDIKPGSYYVAADIFEADGVSNASIIKGPEFYVNEFKNLDWAGLYNLNHKWGTNR